MAVDVPVGRAGAPHARNVEVQRGREVFDGDRRGPQGRAAIAAMIGGPMLYLLGIALFKWVCNERLGPPLSHCAGIVLLALLIPAALSHMLSPLMLGTATTLVLVVVAVWETIALRRS